MTATQPTPNVVPLSESIILVPSVVAITRERIAYTLCAALEGGSTYWCASVNVSDYRGYEWAHEAIAASAPFTFTVLIEYDDEESEPKHPAFTLSQALKAMADDFPNQFDDMVDENEDAETGDVLFQLLCFGEVVYG